MFRVGELGIIRLLRGDDVGLVCSDGMLVFVHGRFSIKSADPSRKTFTHVRTRQDFTYILIDFIGVCYEAEIRDYGVGKWALGG